MPRLLLLVFAIPIAAIVALNSGFVVRSRVGELAALLPVSPPPHIAAVPPDPVAVLAMTQAFALPAGWGGTSALVSPATIAYLVASAPGGIASRTPRPRPSSPATQAERDLARNLEFLRSLDAPDARVRLGPP